MQVVINKPDQIKDKDGNIVQSTTNNAVLPTYDFISTETSNSISSLVLFGRALCWICMALMFIFLIKGSYPMLLLF
jgi:hypothetical protein